MVEKVYNIEDVMGGEEIVIIIIMREPLVVGGKEMGVVTFSYPLKVCVVITKVCHKNHMVEISTCDFFDILRLKHYHMTIPNASLLKYEDDGLIYRFVSGENGRGERLWEHMHIYMEASSLFIIIQVDYGTFCSTKLKTTTYIFPHL